MTWIETLRSLPVAQKDFCADMAAQRAICVERLVHTDDAAACATARAMIKIYDGLVLRVTAYDREEESRGRFRAANGITSTADVG